MSWKATMQEPVEAVSAGEYEATVTEVRALEAAHGPVVRIDFMVTDEDGEVRQVSGIAAYRLSANTKLGRWVAVLLGRMPEVGEEVLAQDLVGRHCHVTVQHKVNPDGKVFANAVELLPIAGDRVGESPANGSSAPA